MVEILIMVINENIAKVNSNNREKYTCGIKSLEHLNNQKNSPSPI
jgi:hypothetical protein